MEQAYIKILEMDEFAGVREQIELLVTGIRSAELMAKEHGDVEEWVNTQATELGRRIVQSHLDLRAANEPKHDGITGADGVERGAIRRVRSRQIETIFGEVEVSRLGYGHPGKSSLFPLDAQLNLPERKYSHGLQRRIAFEVARGSFDSAVEAIASTTGGQVPKLQVEKVAVELTQDFESFYESRGVAAEDTGDPLILSCDGKGIVMRKESLRTATRQAAEREKRKMKTRLSRGEKSNRKRMATVATVYSIERNPRTPEMIMGLADEQEKGKKPRARNKRVWASVAREARTVINEMFDEAFRRDPLQSRPWVLLCDGQDQQLKNIWSCIKERKAESIKLIIDFVHVLEYLWKAAYCFEAEGSKAAEAWVSKRALLILQGKAGHVAGGLRRSATLRQLSSEQRKSVDTCAAYLLKYSHMMRYDKYLARGFPIATGVIEGACRHLIKDRLDITGARWGLEGAESILKLRSLHSSGDFEDYWYFHKERARQRLHLPMYASSRLAA